MTERDKIEAAVTAGARLAIADQEAGLPPRYTSRSDDDDRHPFVRGYLALAERDT